MVEKIIFLAWFSLAAILLPTGCSSTRTPVRTPAEKSKIDLSPRVAVMVADPDELSLLRESCVGSTTITLPARRFHTGIISGTPVVLFCSGKSMINAAAAAQQTIDLFNLQALIVCGVSSSVNPARQAGDVVVPARWAQPGEALLARQKGENYWDIAPGPSNFFDNGAHFGIAFPRAVEIRKDDKAEYCYWFNSSPQLLRLAEEAIPRLRLTPMQNLTVTNRPPTTVTGSNSVSATFMVDNPEVRDWLWQTFKAEMTDSETAAAAQVAAINNVPFLACRAVTEQAGGERNTNEDAVRRVARRNATDFVILLLNQYARDLESRGKK